ncbi:ATP-binding cassette domain-containing protein [Candidatus Saccharibacteria bacterium]|nr:ATP-binding cassette domain-containing protein [candidate division Zixibacteria bacterium]NIT03415.1 ATP-binding cassette domain-containing protein [Candidatus Saccharibacteria bacterium]
MALIQMEKVSKDYRLGETVVHALRGITLQIDKGEFVAVWGPSGSGKTTLLNLIGAIDEPTSGYLSFSGQEISKLPDDRKSELRTDSIGFVFQSFNLIPVLSAFENVMIPLQIKGLPTAEAIKRSAERLNQLGLTDFVKHRPDKLSGGQQQRVAIARALVTNPSLVIADEPTGNLDSDTARNIIQLMRDLNRREGTTFVFSTHDQRLLGQVDRLIRLEDGRILREERNA